MSKNSHFAFFDAKVQQKPIRFQTFTLFIIVIMAKSYIEFLKKCLIFDILLFD